MKLTVYEGGDEIMVHNEDYFEIKMNVIDGQLHVFIGMARPHKGKSLLFSAGEFTSDNPMVVTVEKK